LVLLIYRRFTGLEVLLDNSEQTTIIPNRKSHLQEKEESTHMAWRVLATARQFKLTPEPTQYLLENGCQLIETEYGGELNDAELSGQKLVNLLQGVDAIICGAVRMTREVIEATDRLKVISRRGVGYDTVDIQAATEEKVIVTITPGSVDNGVADHVFALMLAVAKRIVEGQRCVMEGRWQAYVGLEIWRKTMGILGLGRIGKAVAKRALGFEMQLLAYDVVHDEDFANKYGLTYVSLEQLIEQADFISINAPLNEKTFHLLTETHLRLMKPSAILINTARGEIVDEAALICLLQEGKIGGAGLDVFEKEPPGEIPLAKFNNVVLSPHTGGYTRESIVRANLMAAQNVVSLMKRILPDVGEAVVNPKAWRDSGYLHNSL
jgi:D-3-phosphoglycerate dehydrogenase